MKGESVKDKMNVLALFDGIHIFGDIFKTLSTSESYEEDAFLDESSDALKQEN